ncbi:hypothetical protein TNCV_3150921 [Trichonephila clavipes]|nr:hypothetical protein TNCV_3150921 [Trichonephila clavipes]
MALSDSLPQINLGVQGGTQGAVRTNPYSFPFFVFLMESPSIIHLLWIHGVPDWQPASLKEERTDRLIGTSAHSPQRPVVTYTGMGTESPGPHGLLRH